MVREAQDISQKQLAEKIGITPSAITQYEKSIASLSKDKLLACAPLLNLNPKFVEHRVGNPFRQANEKKIIKMFLPALSGDSLDYTIVRHIAEYNNKAAFLILKAINFPEMGTLRIRKWERKGLTSYALLIRDSDENTFLFKRKGDRYFDERELVDLLTKQKETEPGKMFKIESQGISESLYEEIRRWNKIDIIEIDQLFLQESIEDWRRFLEELVVRADGLTVFPQPHEKYDRIKNKLKDLDPNMVHAIYRNLVQKLFTLLENTGL